MEFWHFSETAYPYLPPAETYESIRVQLPSRLMDPEQAAGLWDRYLREWQVADEAGEAHDLIVKALTTHDGPFNWEGRFFQQRHVNIWPRAYQQIEHFYQRAGGFGHLLLMGQAGFLDHDETVRSIETFAAEVKPKLAGLTVAAAGRS